SSRFVPNPTAHFPSYSNSVARTGPASHPQHHPPSSRLTLTPASASHSNDSAVLQSAIKLFDSFTSKRGNRSQPLPNKRSASSTLPYRDSRLTADQANENTRGPHWLLLALLTPQEGLLGGIHAPFESSVPLQWNNSPVRTPSIPTIALFPFPITPNRLKRAQRRTRT
ncbi:hypothetical protein CF326_g9294, partial [Tilletia indica]